jgi:FkbM family methyltransferase
MSKDSNVRVLNVQFPVARPKPSGPAGFHVETETLAFGFNFYPDRANHATIYGWLRSGLLYESDVANFMLRMVKPGDTVVDAGANVGFHTLLMSTLTGKLGRVEAFEPSAENIAEIEANLALNGYTHVHIHPDALGDRDGELLNFVFQPVNSGNSCVWLADAPAGADLRVMHARTLDSELASLGQIKLVKMDIEGCEVKALRGARRLLEQKAVRYWVIENCRQELQRMGEDIDSLRDFMGQFGLSMFVLGWQGDFPKLIPRPLQITGEFISNLLFAFPDDLAEDWMIEDITRFITPPEPGSTAA